MTDKNGGRTEGFYLFAFRQHFDELARRAPDFIPKNERFFWIPNRVLREAAFLSGRQREALRNRLIYNSCTTALLCLAHNLDDYPDAAFAWEVASELLLKQRERVVHPIQYRALKGQDITPKFDHPFLTHGKLKKARRRYREYRERQKEEASTSSPIARDFTPKPHPHPFLPKPAERPEPDRVPTHAPGAYLEGWGE